MEKNQELKQLIREEVAQAMREMVPHECWYCGWFRLRTERPHIRTCHNSKPMKLDERGMCLLWVLADDYKKRVKGNATV
jgi:hypothetical protein